MYIVRTYEELSKRTSTRRRAGMPLVSKKSIRRAIANVVAFGDTDVFPFPFENWFLREKPERVSEIVTELDAKFDDLIEQVPPQFESTLAPAGYTGFRWVTQIDPFWNLYFLAMVIEAGPAIEGARIPEAEDVIHSYRFVDEDKPQLFKEGVSWSSFMQRSLALSQEYGFVIATDISEFYRRINHHRIENALEYVIKNQIPDRIISFLSAFSNGSSYGLPIGGPAARLISEITINQIDRLLVGDKIRFLRFADDYHLFANSLDEAYRALQSLSSMLIVDQGLTLQKAKTRIMTSTEFQNSFPKHLLPEPPAGDTPLESETVKLLKLSLSYDPYSATAIEDYKALQQELSEIDIVGLLAAETQKSQVNISVARRIVATISHLPAHLRLASVKTLVENKEQFFPIMSQVLQMIAEVTRISEPSEKAEIAKLIREAIQSDTHVFGLDLHVAYALRILVEAGGEENLVALQALYEGAAPFVRKDIMIAYAQHGYWYPLSHLRARFALMSQWEQRAFLAASYSLGDEGKHWRDKNKLSFTTADTGVREWCAALKTPTAYGIRL